MSTPNGNGRRRRQPLRAPTREHVVTDDPTREQERQPPPDPTLVDSPWAPRDDDTMVAESPPESAGVNVEPPIREAEAAPEVEQVAARILEDAEDLSPDVDHKVGLAGSSAIPLAILFGLNLVDELDRTAFAVLAPKIRDDLDLSIQGIVTLTSLVGVIALGFQVVGGV